MLRVTCRRCKLLISCDCATLRDAVRISKRHHQHCVARPSERGAIFHTDVTVMPTLEEASRLHQIGANIVPDECTDCNPHKSTRHSADSLP